MNTQETKHEYSKDCPCWDCLEAFRQRQYLIYKSIDEPYEKETPEERHKRIASYKISQPRFH